MLRKLGIEAERSSDPDIVASAQKLLLPGVGAFDHAMVELQARGMVEALNEAVIRRGMMLLGICLGMHLMTDGSAEGGLRGLGWIKGRAERFAATTAARPLRVPHMGWAGIEPVRDCPLFRGFDSVARFYFVHSYHVVCSDSSDEIVRAVYGTPFTAAFARANILGVQFHPEKSHRFGMQLLTNFAAM